jgi:hypothetical protein
VSFVRIRAASAADAAFVVAEDAHALAFWDSLADAGLRRDPLPKERYVWNL